jgi:acyl-CoA synthetase (AMP-forming)/AMP-acid ligase II/acyl carrier protein
MQGERVILLFPPGLDFIAGLFGCLFAGAVAVPAYPPRPRGRQHALAAIVADARPALLLTVSSIASRAAALAEGEPALAGLRWLAVDEPAADDEESWAPRWSHPGADAGSLAFLQYTSGSTAAPKGVMVSHGNLLHNEEMIRMAFGQSEESVIVSWLPLFHDMGLIGGVLQPLYLGASCILMSPAAFLQRPARWLEAISRYGATTSGGPDFAYRLCLERPGGREGLDLSRWSVAFAGAEPVRPETLERFAREMAPYGFRREAFYPCYGLAEATLFVTGGRKEEPPRWIEVESEGLGHGRIRPASAGPAVRLTACGRAWCGQEVAVVDPETGVRRPAGEVGEIWVAGPSVAGGYWQRPEETARTFGARLAGEPDTGPFLRTGDLGFQWGGELYVTGRLKDLIILRGRNHYPQDLELAVERSHPGLRPGCGAAFSVEREGEERLVVVQEVGARREGDVEEMADAVFRQVFEEHEVRLDELVLVEPGTIPKTSSGKIRRAACRAAYLEGTLAVVGGRRSGSLLSGEIEAASPEPGSVEGFLRRQIGEFLGLPAAQVPSGRPLVALGLDSLAAVRLHHALETGLGITLPPFHLLADRTLSDLVVEAGAGGRRETPAPEPLPGPDADAGPVPLSYGQKALWFLQRLAPEGTAYNVAVAARVRQGLDAGALRRAAGGLVDRHPALRTVFVERAGEPWQEVRPPGTVDPVREEPFEGPEDLLRERLEQEAGRPFDLAAGPLLRVVVWRRPQESVLLLVFHHIVVDFWSLSILAADLGTLYEAAVAGRPLPPPAPRASYAGFVHWQRRLLSGKEGERLRAWWEATLTPLPPDLELPADRRRGPVQSFVGGARTFLVEPEVSERVRALAASRTVTLYTALLAAFQALLGRLSGSPRLVVGSPAAGRTQAAFAETVGYFVNPVVLRGDLGGDPTFEELLARTQAVVLDALRHQDYPFLLLAERLEAGREAGRPPVFQVMFALQRGRGPRDQDLAAFACRQEGVRVSLGGLELESMSFRERTSQVDLSLTLAEAGGRLCGLLQHNAGLFDDSTAHRISRHFQTLLAAAVADPGRRIAELPVLTESERQQVLREGRRRRSVPFSGSLPARVAAVARRQPDAAAAAGPGGEVLRYGELVDRADRVAAGLRALGVGPEVLVGIVLEPSPDLPAAVLGTLAAGGACLLLDPDRERSWLEKRLERGGCPVVLTSVSLVRRLPEHGAAEALLERLTEGGGTIGAAGWEGIDPESLAFVVETSETLRQPRLAGLPHRSVAAWVEAWSGTLDPDDLRAVAGESARETVDGVFDLILPLCLGGCVVLGEPAAEASLRSATPARLAAELRAGEAGRARTVRSFGEILGESLQARWLAAGTETIHDSFSSSLGGVWPEEMEAYVLDRSGEPVPVGVAGELWLGGEGLARGYQGSPEKTAERFRPDPFGELPGSRLVRTGDRACWRSGGRLEILGPVEREVELHGHRLDPGTVERLLSEHPGVLRAVAGLQEEPDGVRLVAWAMSAGPAEPTPAELRELLRTRLPEPQVPWAVAVVDRLPLTRTGRTDLQALPRVAGPRETAGTAAPRTEVERMLVEIWRELLQVEAVGIHDNFFRLGGNSLLATQAVARMNEAFQLNLGIETLFRNPTVADLALITDEHLMAQLGEEALEFL